MGNDSINVTADVLIETASKIRNINSNLDTDLENINRSMNELEASWKSEAASSIRDSMNALRPRFEQYKSVVESYADFLVKTADTYSDADDVLNRESKSSFNLN